MIGALAVMVIGSLGLKGVAGLPADSGTYPAAQGMERKLAAVLRRQGFTVTIHPQAIQSAIVYGSRGQCRLSVRDARDGSMVETVFAQDARAIGAVRYLYGGAEYRAFPRFRTHLSRFAAEILGRVGISANVRVPVALATSPGCRDSTFGLGDISYRTVV
jgi:hypothetical protein